MDEKYEIKGIEKIIEKVGKKQLAEYYQVEEDADFINLITKSLKDGKVPNGLEIATYEDYKQAIKDKEGVEVYTTADKEEKNIYEEYTNGGKGLIGIKCVYYEQYGSVGNNLFFYIDKPMKEEQINKMGCNTIINCCQIGKYVMGRKYYEEHEEEIKKIMETKSNFDKNKYVLKNYIESFFERLNGGTYNTALTGCTDPSFIEITEEEKNRAEEFLKELIGKSIGDLKLTELAQIKQRLEEKEKELKQIVDKQMTDIIKQTEGRE